jgi:hypothetical protein
MVILKLPPEQVRASDRGGYDEEGFDKKRFLGGIVGLLFGGGSH